MRFRLVVGGSRKRAQVDPKRVVIHLAWLWKIVGMGRVLGSHRLVASIETKGIGTSLGVRVACNPEKYLGLSTMVGRHKKEAFASFKDRFIKCIESCSVHQLSLGVYGGLSFMDLAKFNIALLAKQGWRLVMKSNYLFARVMKVKYYPKSDFMSASSAVLINMESTTWNLETLRKFLNRILAIPVAEVDLRDERVWRVEEIAGGELLSSQSYNGGACEPHFSKCLAVGVGIDVSPGIQGQNWKIWLANLFVSRGEDQCKWLAIVFWAVWHHRNKVYHQGERQSIVGLVTFVKAYYTESTHTETTTTSISQNDMVWILSMINVVKCNFDAAFNMCLLSSVTGRIFRDNEGYILAACTYPNNFVADATTAEVRACVQAVTVAKELGFWRLVVEGDSLTVFKKVRSLDEDRSSIFVIIKEIKERVQRFEEFTCRFVGRSEMACKDSDSSFLQESIVYVEGKGSMEKDDGSSDAVEAC
ncbi:reverse transcriptase [Gossypium australe]|uniref:Reverse transcriptase n=1 Tax=Gossypium australe TaxID=47621 RepID=A0A5B6UN83_9ROSI|nr:reverse transcriptase [Gossypium australe]